MNPFLSRLVFFTAFFVATRLLGVEKATENRSTAVGSSGVPAIAAPDHPPAKPVEAKQPEERGDTAAKQGSPNIQTSPFALQVQSEIRPLEIKTDFKPLEVQWPKDPIKLDGKFDVVELRVPESKVTVGGKILPDKLELDLNSLPPLQVVFPSLPPKIILELAGVDALRSNTSVVCPCNVTSPKSGGTSTPNGEFRPLSLPPILEADVNNLKERVSKLEKPQNGDREREWRSFLILIAIIAAAGLTGGFGKLVIEEMRERPLTKAALDEQKATIEIQRAKPNYIADAEAVALIEAATTKIKELEERFSRQVRTVYRRPDFEANLLLGVVAALMLPAPFLFKQSMLSLSLNEPMQIVPIFSICLLAATIGLPFVEVMISLFNGWVKKLSIAEIETRRATVDRSGAGGQKGPHQKPEDAH